MPDANGIMKKEIVKQEKGDNWAIRKPLHKETVYAKVSLKLEKETPVTIANAIEKIEFIVDKNIKKILKDKLLAFEGNIIETKKYFKINPIKIENTIIDKVKIYETVTATAGRVLLDASFDKNKIETITDTGIQKILLAHLQQEKYQNQKDENGKIILPQDLAFSEEGIDEMNKNLINHQPVIKVRTFEQGSRFAIGYNGNKKDKYVEAAKGTNLFFAIYQNQKGERNYKTIPLNEVIESQKMGFANAPETDENGNQLLFTLSPNDLVYVPIENEQENLFKIDFNNLSKEQTRRIYKIVSFTGNRLYGIQNTIATSIADKFEFSQLNKLETTIDKIKN
jgi:CRISPR-associated endonuclease Csn1